MNKQAGFTLIELMITIAIIGILAAVALPAYNDYLVRGRIPEATSALATKRVQVEQFFMDNRTYLGSDSVAPNTTFVACEADTSFKYFDFSCTNLTATTYTLQATGKGAMTGFSYTVNESNVKASSGPSGWTGSANCWVVRKSGQCI